MRYLAWLLLAANLGVLIWILAQPGQQPPQHRPAPVPPGVEPLVLLSERDTKPAPAAASPITAPEPEPVPEAPTAGGEAEATSQPPAEDIDTPVATAPETPLLLAPAAPPRTCRTIGPLASEDDASAVSILLSGHGYAPRIRKDKVRKPAGYWVYMPAMPAREARRIVAELDANGMKDYFIGKQNYISLGIFSRKDKAQARQKQVQSLGFDAVLDQRFRVRMVYWLDIEEQDVPLSDTEVWAQIQQHYADVTLQPVSCEQDGVPPGAGLPPPGGSHTIAWPFRVSPA